MRPPKPYICAILLLFILTLSHHALLCYRSCSVEFDDDDGYESDVVNHQGEGEGGGQGCLFRTWKEAHEALGLDKLPDWFELEAERKAKEKEEAARAGGGEGALAAPESSAHPFGGGMTYDSQEGGYQAPAAPAHMGGPW